MRQTLCALLLAVTLLQANSKGQTKTSGWTFADFNATITKTGFAFQPGSPEIRELAAVSRNLDDLRAQYGSNADTPQEISKRFAPEYSNSMARNEFAIAHLPPNSRDALPILRDVSADLHIKSVYFSKSMGLVGTVVPSIIKIRVTVPIPTASGVKSSDLSVRANPHYLGTKSPCAYILANGTHSTEAHRVEDT
jgi:hypothetical protein